MNGWEFLFRNKNETQQTRTLHTHTYLVLSSACKSIEIFLCDAIYSSGWRKEQLYSVLSLDNIHFYLCHSCLSLINVVKNEALVHTTKHTLRDRERERETPLALALAINRMIKKYARTLYCLREIEMLLVWMVFDIIQTTGRL